MSELESRNLIYDWNLKGTPELQLPERLSFLDKTLSAGLASAGVFQPDLEGQQQILRGLAAAGLQAVNLGHPARARVGALVDGIRRENLPLQPSVSIGASVSQVGACGPGLEVRIHRSLSALALAAEGIPAETAVDRLMEAATAARDRGLTVIWVAEDATRTAPAQLASAMGKLQAAGVATVALVDSVGCATPDGVQRLMGFVRQQSGGLRFEWGGRNDRGLAVVNALVALSHGAERVCGTMLGLGEGAGVIALDLLLTNVALMERTAADLMALKDLCHTVARLCRVVVPVNYPVFGSDAFRTATGVHAAAIVKARKKGDVWLADRVYSGIPAGLFGLSQVVDIGPMSGLSNVSCWLEERGLSYTPDDVTRILQRAKQSNRTLTEEEVREALSSSPAPSR